MFPLGMANQRDKLLAALGQVVSHVDDLDAVVPVLQQLGRDHRRFGVVRDHYPAVGQALLATLEHFSSEWTPELARDWAAAYDRRRPGDACAGRRGRRDAAVVARHGDGGRSAGRRHRSADRAAPAPLPTARPVGGGRVPTRPRPALVHAGDAAGTRRVLRAARAPRAGRSGQPRARPGDAGGRRAPPRRAGGHRPRPRRRHARPAAHRRRHGPGTVQGGPVPARPAAEHPVRPPLLGRSDPATSTTSPPCDTCASQRTAPRAVRLRRAAERRRGQRHGRRRARRADWRVPRGVRLRVARDGAPRDRAGRRHPRDRCTSKPSATRRQRHDGPLRRHSPATDPPPDPRARAVDALRTDADRASRPERGEVAQFQERVRPSWPSATPPRPRCGPRSSTTSARSSSGSASTATTRTGNRRPAGRPSSSRRSRP